MHSPGERDPDLLWAPTGEQGAATAMARFSARVRARVPAAPAVDAPYADWHAWSVAHPAEFWSEVWRFCDVVATTRDGAEPWDAVVEGFDRMGAPPAALWPRVLCGAGGNLSANAPPQRGF